MFTTLLQVAAGGAIGASARFLTGVGVTRAFGTGLPIPVGVLLCNVVGSFLMGCLVVVLGQKAMPQLNPFLATGILGGFTTFSSFSLEAYGLFERGQAGLAALYVGLNVCVSLGAIAAGFAVTRGIMA